MRRLRAGYTFDASAKRRVNANYWWAYIAEILERLGLCADAISVSDLPHQLDSLSLLFLGGVDAAPMAGDLERWVQSGGVLIACNQSYLDGLAGNRFAESVPQRNGEFSIGGELTLRETEFSSGIHSPRHPDKPLLAASALRLVDPIDSLVVAESGGHAVVTARKLGGGWVFYIGFDIAQTFWVIQQGRRIDRDHDGDGYWRTPDAIVIGQYEAEVAYTDELLFLLQNMVSVQPFPLIHRLPPSGECIPDALFYYGGDDEGLVGDQLPAARFMAEHGLPYHINCMANDKGFGIGPEEIAELDRLGTDLSLHYNFIDGFEHPGGFTRDDVLRQTREFVEHFGRYPVCSVNHWCRWTGSVEPAVWMSEAGVSADGSFFSCPADVLNPVNRHGFSFGTSYPFHFYTDHTGCVSGFERSGNPETARGERSGNPETRCGSGNERLEFLELPITAYEMGYVGDQLDTASLELAFRAAVHYQSTMVFFYHPIYIARYPACREAITRLLALIEESGLSIAHSSPDALVRWWTARAGIRVSDVVLNPLNQVQGQDDEKRVKFTASTPPGGAFIATIPLGSHQTARTNRPHRIIEKFGHRWVQAVVAEGESSVEIELG